LPAGRRTTGRFRREIACAVGDACRSVAEAAEAFGVSWPTAHATVIEAANEQLGDPEPVTVLGIDDRGGVARAVIVPCRSQLAPSRTRSDERKVMSGWSRRAGSRPT